MWNLATDPCKVGFALDQALNMIRSQNMYVKQKIKLQLTFIVQLEHVKLILSFDNFFIIFRAVL